MEGSEPQLQITVPDAVAAGVYANGASVWHTPHEFTIDFLALQPMAPDAPSVIPCLVTSRVRIPVSVVFDLIKALNDNMTKYEQQFGEIRRIEPQG